MTDFNRFGKESKNRAYTYVEDYNDPPVEVIEEFKGEIIDLNLDDELPCTPNNVMLENEYSKNNF